MMPLKSISQSSITVAGIEIIAHQLNNGERVIEAEGVHALVHKMETHPLTPADRLARFSKGTTQ